MMWFNIDTDSKLVNNGMLLGAKAGDIVRSHTDNLTLLEDKNIPVTRFSQDKTL